MIKHITIKGFKSIRKLELELEPINLLIGANGAGKSNFISFFKLVNKIKDQGLKNYTVQQGGVNNILYFGQKETDSLQGLLNFNNKNAYDFCLKINELGLFYIKSEKHYYNGYKDKENKYKQWGVMSAGSDIEESELLIKNSKLFAGSFLDDSISSFRIYHFHDTSPTAKIKQQCSINDNKSLREDGQNLAAFLFYLKIKYPKRYKKIVRVIQSIAPFFEDFDLEPNRINEEFIRLEWKEFNSDMYLNAHHLSDGTLRFIALTCLLLQPNPPATIIIDEPELGLHPFAVNKLAGLIKKASAKSQIIIATQSVNLVSNFEPKEIITVDRKEGQSIFERLKSENLKDWLEDYSLGDLWTKSVIGGQPW